MNALLVCLDSRHDFIPNEFSDQDLLDLSVALQSLKRLEISNPHRRTSGSSKYPVPAERNTVRGPRYLAHKSGKVVALGQAD